MAVVLAVDRDLADFIEASRRRPWRWGEHDCTLFGADWIVQRIGRDPAETWRGGYATARECRDLLDSHGGLLAIVRDSLAMIGLRETDDPQTGDVGIVRAPAETPDGVMPREIAAVRQGDMWVCRGIRPAIMADRFPTVAAWRVPG